MRETEAAAQAFADYVALGKDRSLEALQRRYAAEKNPPTKSLKTLQNWSAWHGWQDRVDKHVAAQNALVLKRMQTDIAGERVRALRPLLKARASIEVQIDQGVPVDPRELTKINAQIMQLLGEPLTDAHVQSIKLKGDVVISEVPVFSQHDPLNHADKEAADGAGVADDQAADAD